MSRRVVVGSLAVLAAAMVALAQLTGRDGAEPHPLGTEVTVGHVDFGGGQRGVRTQIGLTVLAVRTGTQAELEAHGFRVDADDSDSTPYYIDARYVNKGPNPVRRNLSVGLTDSEDKLIPRPILLDLGAEPFEPCREVSRGTFRPGESYASCTLALAPEGVDVAKVHFLSDNGSGKEPEFVYWATE